MIAIWGANGFIGRHVTRTLDSADLKIFARSFEGFPFSSQAKAITADFSKPLEYMHELDVTEALVLLTTGTLSRGSDMTPEQEVEANVALYRDFFSALRDVKKPPAHIIYVSSSAVYGLSESRPIDETHPVRPISAYGEGKKQIEQLIENEQKNGHFKYSILRVSNPVGVWCKRRALLPVILEAARTNKPVPVFGDGTMTRDYLDVGELAQAVKLLALKPGANEIYNVGAGIGHTITDVIEIASTAIGKNIAIEHVQASMNDVPYSVLDCKKIKNALGWQAKKDLKDIVKTMWDAE